MTATETNPKEKYLKKYVELVKAKQRYPSMEELNKAGVPRGAIKNQFGCIQKFTIEAKKKYPKVFDEIFSSSDFTTARLNNAKRSLKDVTEFIICAAVSGKQVNEKALESLKTWMKETGGVVIFQPIFDPATNRQKTPAGDIITFFDPKLKPYQFIWTDLKLNNKVKLSKIKVQAKQLDPHTGLERIAENEGITLVGATKRRLSPQANLSQFPGYIVSGGAITVNDYESDFSASQRTAELSEYEHTFGGTYVRLDGKNKFSFTPIQFDSKDGHFTLDSIRYFANGKVSEVSPYLITFGDLHVEELTDEMFDKAVEILEDKNPVELDLHDVFTGVRCSPFNKRRPELQYLEMKEYKLETVETSLRDLVFVLNSFAERVGTVNVIDSNHHAFLEHWITSGAYRQGDPRDIRFAHQLAAEFTISPEIPILKLACGLLKDIKLADNIKFHKGHVSLKYAGIERSSHGHVGAGGKKNPSFRKLGYALGKLANTAHTHKCQIIGGIWSPGTFSGVGDDRAAYAKTGASDWAQAYIETYEDGQRNLVHIL